MSHTIPSIKNRKQRVYIVLRMLKRLFPEAKPALHFSHPWEALVAVMLSAQTTDKQVNKITEKLFKKYRTPDAYARTKIDIFAKDISSIGLYRRKAKNIIASANIIKNQWGGKLPKTMEEMLTLPGVGRKTANVVLGIVYGIHSGIAVDTHVARLSKKFGLTIHTDPKKIERDLVAIIPKKEWPLFTLRMIEYGRVYSPARKVHDKDDSISRAFRRSLP